MVEREKKFRKYDRGLLITIFIIISIAIVTAVFTSEDIDEVCDVNGSVLYKSNGTWTCGVIQSAGAITAQANLWYHNETSPLTVSIPTANTYYNITGLEEYNTNNINTDNDSIMTIIYEGQYYIQVAASFSGGGSETYEMELFINEIEQEKGCEFHRKMGTAGDVGSASLTCNLELNVNDELRIKMENEDVTPTDADIYNIIFHAHRLTGFSNSSTSDTNETTRMNNIADFSCSGTDKVSSFLTNGTPVCTTDGGGAAAGENETLMIAHECIGTCDTFINTIEKV